MTFLETILTWIAGWILQYLASKVSTQVAEKIQDMERDKQRGEVNDANIKAYEDAVSRADRIKAAQALLNRDTP